MAILSVFLIVRAGLRFLQEYESRQKLQRLRADIALGDADIAAGRVSEYESTDALMSELLEEQ